MRSWQRAPNVRGYQTVADILSTIQFFQRKELVQVENPDSFLKICIFVHL